MTNLRKYRAFSRSTWLKCSNCGDDFRGKSAVLCPKCRQTKYRYKKKVNEQPKDNDIGKHHKYYKAKRLRHSYTVTGRTWDYCNSCGRKTNKNELITVVNKKLDMELMVCKDCFDKYGK